MAKPTLLELVQRIMSNMDYDDVASIADTEESEQIARVVEEVYFDLVDEYDLANTKGLVSLVGLGDTARPTTMQIPQAVSSLEWVRYDVRTGVADAKQYRDIRYCEPHEFIRRTSFRDSLDTTNFLVITPATDVSLIVGIKDPPNYWTTFDDEFIIFDAHDSDVETTMQSSKTQAFGVIRPSFTSLSDAFTPDLPEHLFQLLFHESQSRCAAYFKQEANPVADREARRHRVRSQRTNHRKRKEYGYPAIGR